MAKIKITTISSRAEFESKIDQCAQLETAQHLIEAELAQKVLEIKENYGEQIEAHKKEVKRLTAECAQYAASNTVQLFGKNRSSETALARFGFRTGQPTLKNTGKKKDAEIIAELIKKDANSQYVSKKLSLDKDAIRNAIENGVVWLKSFFVVQQDEAFFINPKTDGE